MGADSHDLRVGHWKRGSDANNKGWGVLHGLVCVELLSWVTEDSGLRTGEICILLPCWCHPGPVFGVFIVQWVDRLQDSKGYMKVVRWCLVRWRQVGLAASSVSRKLSANSCDGRALKIWGLIEGWGVAKDKKQGKRGGYQKHDGDHVNNQKIEPKNYFKSTLTIYSNPKSTPKVL